MKLYHYYSLNAKLPISLSLSYWTQIGVNPYNVVMLSHSIISPFLLGLVQHWTRSFINPLANPSQACTWNKFMHISYHSSISVSTLMLQNFIIYILNSYFFNHKECIIVLWLWTQRFQTVVRYYVSILHIGMELLTLGHFKNL